MIEKKEKLLNLSEAAQFLGITEDNLKKLSEAGEVLAYKVGGVFLRFKVEQLTVIKPNLKEKLESLSSKPEKAGTMPTREKYTFFERLREFWYFYDFYIVALLIIGFILYVIFKLGV